MNCIWLAATLLGLVTADVSHILHNYQNQGQGLQVTSIPGNTVTHKPIYKIPATRYESTDRIRPFQYSPPTSQFNNFGGNQGNFHRITRDYNTAEANRNVVYSQPGFYSQQGSINRQSYSDPRNRVSINSYQQPIANNAANTYQYNRFAASNQYPTFSTAPHFQQYQQQATVQRNQYVAPPIYNPTFYSPSATTQTNYYKQPFANNNQKYHQQSSGFNTAASQRVGNVARNQFTTPIRQYTPNLFSKSSPFAHTTASPVVNITPPSYKRHTTPAPAVRFTTPVTYPPPKLSDIILSSASTKQPFVVDVYTPPPIVSSTISTLKDSGSLHEGKEPLPVAPILAHKPVTPVKKPTIIYSPDNTDDHTRNGPLTKNNLIDPSFNFISTTTANPIVPQRNLFNPSLKFVSSSANPTIPPRNNIGHVQSNPLRSTVTTDYENHHQYVNNQEPKEITTHYEQSHVEHINHNIHEPVRQIIDHVQPIQTPPPNIISSHYDETLSGRNNYEDQSVHNLHQNIDVSRTYLEPETHQPEEEGDGYFYLKPAIEFQ